MNPLKSVYACPWKCYKETDLHTKELFLLFFTFTLFVRFKIQIVFYY